MEIKIVPTTIEYLIARLTMLGEVARVKYLIKSTFFYFNL